MLGKLRKDAGKPVSVNTEDQFATYAVSMLGELQNMSTARNFDFLAYLIEMAMIEASEISAKRSGNTGVHSTDFRAEKLAKSYMNGQSLS